MPVYFRDYCAGLLASSKCAVYGDTVAAVAVSVRRRNLDEADIDWHSL